MCSCGKSGSQQTTSTSTARSTATMARGATSGHVHREAPAPSVAGNEIALRYRGTRALLVRGPVSGVGYACYPGDTIAVHERDVAQLIGSGSFTRATA